MREAAGTHNPCAGGAGATPAGGRAGAGEISLTCQLLTCNALLVPRTESSLQQEIRQSRPFRSKGHEALLGLIRTASLLRQSVARTIEPHGITPQQYNVLRILRGAGEEALPTLEVAERLLEPSPGVTRLLDKLEARGLASRERCPEDRRQVLCRITGEGLALLDAMRAEVEAMEASALEMLEPAELERLIELLDRIRAAYAREVSAAGP